MTYQRLEFFTFCMIEVLCVTEFIHLSFNDKLRFCNLKKLNDTHMKKAPSNKVLPFTSRLNMDNCMSSWYIESTRYKKFLN